jgi:hypothetical protein
VRYRDRDAREILLVAAGCGRVRGELDQVRLLDLELGARARNGSAKRHRVEAEQHVTGRDTGSFLITALEQDARHARANLDLARTAQLRRILEVERERARLHVDDADDRRRRGRQCLRSLTPRRRKPRNQKEKT